MIQGIGAGLASQQAHDASIFRCAINIALASTDSPLVFRVCALHSKRVDRGETPAALPSVTGSSGQNTTLNERISHGFMENSNDEPEILTGTSFSSIRSHSLTCCGGFAKDMVTGPRTPCAS